MDSKYKKMKEEEEYLKTKNFLFYLSSMFPKTDGGYYSFGEIKVDNQNLNEEIKEFINRIGGVEKFFAFFANCYMSTNPKYIKTVKKYVHKFRVQPHRLRMQGTITTQKIVINFENVKTTEFAS